MSPAAEPVAVPNEPEPDTPPAAPNRASTPRRPATPAEARALAHPLRLRIIRLLFDRSLTNRELARALDEHPATVLHHVRTLVGTGFIAADPPRRGPRGTREKPYHSTGKSWTVSLEEGFDLPVSRAVLRAFLAELRDAEPDDDLDTSRLALNLSAASRRELDDRLRSLLDDFASRPPDPDGEPWALFLALHRRAPVPGTADAAADATPTPAPGPAADIEIADGAADDPLAVLLVEAQWAELSARYGEPDPQPASLRAPQAFAPPEGGFVLLRVGKEAVGCGGFCRWDDTGAELKAIYIAPLHRGRGYGRRLVRALELRARAAGYRAVRLETGDAQPEAISLYETLGYHRIERYGRYRNFPRSLCFERRL